jgi:pyoverdine/dityrosine biosynthesis protein Dit1
MARRRTLVKKRKSQKLKKSHNNKRRKTYRKMRGGLYIDSIELGLDKVIKYINSLGTLYICGVKFFVVKNMNGTDSLRIDEEYTSLYSANQTGYVVNEIKYSINDSKLYVKCFFRGRAYYIKPYEFSMEDRDKEIIQHIQNYTDEDYRRLTKDNISHNPSDNGNRETP